MRVRIGCAVSIDDVADLLVGCICGCADCMRAATWFTQHAAHAHAHASRTDSPTAKFVTQTNRHKRLQAKSENVWMLPVVFEPAYFGQFQVTAKVPPFFRWLRHVSHTVTKNNHRCFSCANYLLLVFSKFVLQTNDVFLLRLWSIVTCRNVCVACGFCSFVLWLFNLPCRCLFLHRSVQRSFYLFAYLLLNRNVFLQPW